MRVLYRESDRLFRLRKDTARKYHKSGMKVFILPHLMRLDNKWLLPYNLPLLQDFDIVVEQYTKSNCNPQTGMYVAFYAEKRRV